MTRFWAVLLAFGAPSVLAQPSVDLLGLVANHFNNANSFVVKGTASAAIPGSSWRVSYAFYTEGAQPRFLPLSMHGPSIRVVSTTGQMKVALATPGATDPRPERGFGLEPFGKDNELALNLVDAQKGRNRNNHRWRAPIFVRNHRCHLRLFPGIQTAFVHRPQAPVYRSLGSHCSARSEIQRR
jgi:hypothetical protein